jgi:anti-sigma factor RsiW
MSPAHAISTQDPTRHGMQHPSDHDVDLFVLQRVPAEERLRVELHLLKCRACSREVEKTAEFVTALRAVCRAGVVH